MPVFRALVFRRPLVPKLTFGVLTFGVLTFGVLTFGVLMFGVLMFGVPVFGVLMSCLAVFGAPASRGPAASLVP